MIELSRFVLEALRKDEEFILYRVRSEDDVPQAAFASYGAPSDLGRDAVSVFGRDEASRSRVLVLSPATEHPPPQSSSARPLESNRHWSGGVPEAKENAGRKISQHNKLALMVDAPR